MNPGIRPVLFALQNWQCLVHRSLILRFWRLIQHTRPKHGIALLRLYGNVQLGETGPTTFFDIVQVEEESQDADAGGQALLMWKIVMVLPIELPWLVLKQLKVLAIVHLGLGCIG